jgi:hypothetical protein
MVLRKAPWLTRLPSPRGGRTRVHFRRRPHPPEVVQVLQRRRVLHLELHPQALRMLPAIEDTWNRVPDELYSGMALFNCYLCGLPPT